MCSCFVHNSTATRSTSRRQRRIPCRSGGGVKWPRARHRNWLRQSNLVGPWALPCLSGSIPTSRAIGIGQSAWGQPWGCPQLILLFQVVAAINGRSDDTSPDFLANPELRPASFRHNFLTIVFRGTLRIAAKRRPVGMDGRDAVRVTTTLTRAQYQRLEELAAKHGVKIAWLVRKAVDDMLERAEGGPLLPFSQS